MKTKTLLMMVASSAGALCAMTSQIEAATQSIPLSLPPGFCLLANNLHVGDNRLNTVFPSVPVESQVLKFANNNYTADIFDGSNWLDALTGNPSRTTVSPGEGFFFFNPSSQNLQVTFTGEVPQGPLTICFPPGFALVGSPVPRPLFLNSSNGFPRALELEILRYIRPGQQYGPGYRCMIVDGSTWLDCATGNPTTLPIPVGEGFFIYNPLGTALCWTTSFSVD